ncbi:helix-turn-helix domain-containing protein [Bilophila wadsworthia]|nr:helix-turn-helix transcriptional regulator [Bilophila wadsworthia]
MDEYQRFFGANIRKLRKLHGLTLEQLAGRSGLSERYVSEVERGMANLG